MTDKERQTLADLERLISLLWIAAIAASLWIFVLLGACIAIKCFGGACP